MDSNQHIHKRRKTDIIYWLNNSSALDEQFISHQLDNTLLQDGVNHLH